MYRYLGLYLGYLWTILTSQSVNSRKRIRGAELGSHPLEY